MNNYLRSILLVVLAGMCLSALRAAPTIPSSTGGNVTQNKLTIGGVEYVRLQAVPAPDYYFVGWNDGCTRNPRQVPTSDNGSYSANFAKHTTPLYTTYFRTYSDKGGPTSYVWTNSTNDGEGYTVTTTPNGNFDFTGWYVNGEKKLSLPQQTYYIVGDSAFIKSVYGVNKSYVVTGTPLLEGEDSLFTTTVPGGTACLRTPTCVKTNIYTLRATADAGYYFAGWQDGSEQVVSQRNPLVLNYPTETELTYSAVFQRVTAFHVDSLRNVSEGGKFTLTRSNDCDQFTLTATPFTGYQFDGWSDGNTENPRTYTAPATGSGDTARIMAHFGPIMAAYTVPENHVTGGKIDTVGTHYSVCNPRYLLSAKADEGYEFVGWSDGCVRNPRIWLPKGAHDAEFAANFRKTERILPHYTNAYLYVDMTPDTVECHPRYTANISNTSIHQFVRWKDGDDQSTPTRTWIDPHDGDTCTFLYSDIYYKFGYLYHLDVVDAESASTPLGTIEAPAQSTCYQNEDTIPQLKVYAKPKEGAEFVGWVDESGNVVSVRNPLPYNSHMSNHQPLTWRAKFRQHDPTLYPFCENTYVRITANGECEPTYTITPTRDDKFEFSYWKSDIDLPAERTYKPTEEGIWDTVVYDPRKYAYEEAITNAPDTGEVAVAGQNASVCDEVYYLLQANAQEGFHFTGWEDSTGNIVSQRNPWKVYPQFRDTTLTYTAHFSDLNIGTYSVYREGGRGGVLRVEYPNDPCSKEYTFFFDPNIGYHFEGWKEEPEVGKEVTSLTRTVPDGFSRIAVWQHDKMAYTVTAKTENSEAEDIADVCAPTFYLYARVPQKGYRFVSWKDGSTENPRIVYPGAQTETYQAEFTFADCRAIIEQGNDNNCGGTVTIEQLSGTNDPTAPCDCNYFAVPHAPTGYVFAGWTDGTAANPRLIVMDHVVNTFTAIFVSKDNQFLTWYDNRLDIVTESLDMTAYDMTVYVDGVPLDPTPALTTNEKGLFTLPLASIAGNAHAGDKLLVVLTDKETGENYSGMEVQIPFIFTGADAATTTVWSEVTQPDNIRLDQTGVVVRDGATLNFDIATAIGPLEIIEDAKAIVSAPLTVTSITMRGNGPKDKFPQLVANRGVINRNNDTIYYDYWLNYDYYYPLAMPDTVVCKDIRTRIGDTPYFEASWYDGAKRATGAHSWTVYNDLAEDAQFGPSEGFIIFGEGNDWNGKMQDTAYIRMPMHYDLTTGEITSRSVPVHAYNPEGNTNRVNDQNWNLIGIPYLANMSGMDSVGSSGGGSESILLQAGQLIKHTNDNGAWTGGYDWVGDARYITIQQNGYQDYEQVRITEATLRPFNSYFIQSSGEGELVFNFSRVLSAPKRQAARTEYDFDLTLSASDKSDRTGLLIGDAFSTRYEFNADLAKMSGSTQPITLYTLMEGQPLAFCAIDKETAKQAIPLGFATRQGGEHTFALRDREAAAEQFELIALIDHEAGTATNLLEGDYTFTLSGKTSSDTRFAINAYVRQQKDNPTDLSGSLWQEGKVTGSTEKAGFGSLTPGLYTLTGQRIADLHGTATNIPAGVYLIVTEDGIRKEVLR